MNNIYKIFFALACFLTAASAAYASLNYDSTHNNFLSDAVLRISGDYILVGDIFDKGSFDNSLAVSNNLIFMNTNGKFQSGDRQISKDYFSTNGITVNSAKNFEISSIDGLKPLVFGFAGYNSGNKITMNKKFVVNNGFTLLASQTSLNTNTIYADRVLAENLLFFDNSNLRVTSGELELTKDGTAQANSIVYGADKSPYCIVVKWSNAYNVFNETKDKSAAHFQNKDKTTTGADNWASGGIPGDKDNENACNASWSITYSVEQPGRSKENNGNVLAQKTCCPRGYFVYQADVDYQEGSQKAGKMVCCRFFP